MGYDPGREPPGRGGAGRESNRRVDLARRRGRRIRDGPRRRVRGGRRGEPAADQPLPEQGPASGEADADRARGTPQPFGRPADREPFEVAEDDRRPVLLREPDEFGVERLAEFGAAGVGLGPGGDLGRRAVLAGAPAGRIRPRPRRDPSRHAVEEPPEVPARPDRPGTPGQNEERRLEGVLGVARVAEAPPADAQDHRPVAVDHRRERRLGRDAGLLRLGPPGHEAVEQLVVRQPRRRRPREEGAESTAQGHVGAHRISPEPSSDTPPLPRSPAAISFFSTVRPRIGRPRAGRPSRPHGRGLLSPARPRLRAEVDQASDEVAKGDVFVHVVRARLELILAPAHALQDELGGFRIAVRDEFLHVLVGARTPE